MSSREADPLSIRRRVGEEIWKEKRDSLSLFFLSACITTTEQRIDKAPFDSLHHLCLSLKEEEEERKRAGNAAKWNGKKIFDNATRTKHKSKCVCASVLSNYPAK